MKTLHWLREEARAIALVTLYFAGCFVMVMLLKQLWLADYGIELRTIPTALFAALVTAKVVIVLEKAPITRWLRGSPGIVEVITRTTLYTFVVLVVMIVEKAFEARDEQGGFTAALSHVFAHPDMPKVGATTIAVGLSFLAYNTFHVVRRAIGDARMFELFLSNKGAARRTPQGA